MYWIQGSHEEINGVCFVKTGSVKAEETWTGSSSQTSDAVDEKDLEVAIDAFLNGADVVLEEDRSNRDGMI